MSAKYFKNPSSPSSEINNLLMELPEIVSSNKQEKLSTEDRLKLNAIIVHIHNARDTLTDGIAALGASLVKMAAHDEADQDTVLHIGCLIEYLSNDLSGGHDLESKIMNKIHENETASVSLKQIKIG